MYIYKTFLKANGKTGFKNADHLGVRRCYLGWVMSKHPMVLYFYIQFKSLITLTKKMPLFIPINDPVSP